MIALSTRWQSTPTQSGRGLVAGLRSLGFTEVELENRYYGQEIPNADDPAVLLPARGDSRVGRWHDVGHAAVQENLGLDRLAEAGIA